MNTFTLPEKLANAAFVVALLAMGIWFWAMFFFEATR